VMRFDGVFPDTAALLQTLPGIGPSTAAAIAAFCFNERTSILDGNVKRVLSRVLAYEADLAVSSNERELWRWAQDLLPRRAADMPVYTQALMDVGSMLCRPHKTQCEVCPVQTLCVAYLNHQCLSYPVRTRKLKRSSASLWLLWAVNGQRQVWLQKRPASGIWAGLFCLPAFDTEADLLAACSPTPAVQHLAAFKHVLTHRDLHIHTVCWQVSARQIPRVPGQWVNAQDWPALGLPAPIRSLLKGEKG